eukprot:12276785-Karenia_brevis.AAC.1
MQMFSLISAKDLSVSQSTKQWNHQDYAGECKTKEERSGQFQCIGQLRLSTTSWRHPRLRVAPTKC